MMGLVQHPLNRSQGQTTLIPVKRTFDPTHNGSKGKSMIDYNAIRMKVGYWESIFWRNNYMKYICYQLDYFYVEDKVEFKESWYY